MAPGEHTYLDYPQYPGDLPEFNNWGMPVTTLEQAYRLDPGYGLPKEEQSHINGVMATLWAEARYIHILGDDRPARVVAVRQNLEHLIAHGADNSVSGSE